MPIFELGWAIPVKSHMWKFGWEWVSLSRVIVVTSKQKIKLKNKASKASRLWTVQRGAYNNWKHLKFWEAALFSGILMVSISSKLEVFDFSGGRSPLVGGLTIIEGIWNYGHLLYLVANGYRLYFIKIGGIWIVRGQKTPIGGVTFDLWCPFSNLAELFQSKVICKTLGWTGWNWRYGGMSILRWGRSSLLGRLRVTCDGHFWTLPSYSSQKSCVKTWFGLVEPFKSYRDNKKKKKLKQVKPLGFDPPRGRAYNNRKHLKIWESALFSG